VLGVSGPSGCVMYLPVGLVCWNNWNLTYLLDIKFMHIKNFKLVPLFFFVCLCCFFCFFHLSLYDKKTLPEHYYLGPLDLFFLTPMKPEGQLCSGV